LWAGVKGHTQEGRETKEFRSIAELRGKKGRGTWWPKTTPGEAAEKTFGWVGGGGGAWSNFRYRGKERIEHTKVGGSPQCPAQKGNQKGPAESCPSSQKNQVWPRSEEKEQLEKGSLRGGGGRPIKEAGNRAYTQGEPSTERGRKEKTGNRAVEVSGQ